jgi:putative hydrolase of the HAD superfamily
MSDSPIPPNIRALFFDAVGTLIEPDPPVVEVYQLAGKRHGCEMSAELILRRFRDAFQIEEQADAANGLSVSEVRERERWRSIVSRVFDGCRSIDSIFAELWTHFARPDAWRVVESAGEVLRGLSDMGYLLGLASNFDGRLHAIADQLPNLAPAKLRVISSEVGWRKPSPRFFAAVVSAAGCKAGQILFIGDRRDTDYDGAIASGVNAVLLDSESKASPGVRHIRRLRELLV